MVTKIKRSQFKDFNEEVEDVIGPSISGVGVISVIYDDNNARILISGSLTDYYTQNETDALLTTVSGDITNKIPTESLYYNYRGSLEYLVSSVGSAEKIVAVDCNNVVEGNISIPSNIQLFYIDGCITTVSSGITLTIYSPNNVLAKQTQQIFAGIGLSPIHFLNPGTVYPEWWGIDGVGDEIQFQKAYDSLINGGKVLINGLNYSVNLYSAVSSNTQTEISPWTTITLASGCHCQVFYVYECDNVRFYGGGTVDGNHNNQSGVDYTMNFGLHSSSNIKIDGLKIKSGLCRGLYVTECENVVIRDCEILDCGRNGIMTYQSSHIKILDNYFHDNGDTGEGHLFIYSGTIDIIVKGNTFGVTGQLIGQSHGIYVLGTAGCIIADNGFYDIYGFGIETQPSVSGTGVIINGNHFHNCGNAPSETGALFIGCPRTIVSNNFIGESVEHGIFEFNGSDSIISSNIIINTSGVLSVGIREMNDTSNTIVLGNLVIDDQAVPTQKYGIIIENESAVVIGNNVLGNVHSYLEMNDAAQQSKMGNLELYNDPIPAGGALVFSDSQRRSTYKAVLTDNLHVSKTYFHTLFLTASGANRGVYCDGVYEAGNEFWVKNVGNFYSIEFDASGISLYVPASGVAYFIYDGFSWVNMYKSF